MTDGSDSIPAKPSDWGRPPGEKIPDGSWLPATTILWPDEEAGPWVVTLHWQVIDERPEAVAMDIASSLDPRSQHQRFEKSLVTMPAVGIPLRTSILRSLNVAEIIAEQRIQTAEILRKYFADNELAEIWEQPAVDMRDTTRQRLERAAKVYRQALQKGQRPNKEIARHFGISDSAAAKLAYRARSAGLLPPTAKGVARARADGDDSAKA